MALSLVLRTASKFQGYPSVLRCSGIAFNKDTGSFSYLTSRTSANLAQNSLLAAGVKPQILTAPATRCMSVSKDHRLMWTVERLFSLALVGLVPATIAFPNPVLDNVAVIAICLHLHWGIEAMAQDYVRPVIFGNVIPKIALMAVYAITAVTLGGLLYFNYNDIGLGKAIRKLWAIKAS